MSVEDARRTYIVLSRVADQHDCWCADDAGVLRCGAWLWLDVDAASIALDLIVAQIHRVTGGPHPRLLGLDGAAIALHAGVAWG